MGVRGARVEFTGDDTLLLDERDSQSLHLERIKRRRLVVVIDWWPCGMSLVVVGQEQGPKQLEIWPFFRFLASST